MEDLQSLKLPHLSEVFFHICDLGHGTFKKVNTIFEYTFRLPIFLSGVLTKPKIGSKSPNNELVSGKIKK